MSNQFINGYLVGMSQGSGGGGGGVPSILIVGLTTTFVFNLVGDSLIMPTLQLKPVLTLFI